MHGILVEQTSVEWTSKKHLSLSLSVCLSVYLPVSLYLSTHLSFCLPDSPRCTTLARPSCSPGEGRRLGIPCQMVEQIRLHTQVRVELFSGVWRAYSGNNEARTMSVVTSSWQVNNPKSE